MSLFKIIIDNRNYASWNIVKANSLEPASIDLSNPDHHKLFHSDIFTFNNNVVEIQHSSVRTVDNIPGVLIIADNKTYGRNKGKNGKLLYKCIPDDTRIPAFLVPYEIKELGFYKVLPNLYVTIRFSYWTDKHPYANLTQTIGPVDVLDNYYEYQLYCKSLNSSIQKFTKDTTKAISQKADRHDVFIENLCKTHPQIENRTDWYVFTIDPAKSQDYDDAFSIKKLGEETLLSIYIANVTVWMDALNLWSSFSQRISTIYLPDRKRPMLPTILSDCLCSLQSNATRVAFVMDILIDNDNNIVSIKYSNCIIRVSKNFIYEELALLKNSSYIMTLDIAKKLSKKYKYINSVRNSHEVVCYLMILMNYHCAKELLKTHSGIFRSTIVKGERRIIEVPDTLPEDVANYLKIWNSSCGQYVDVSSIDKKYVEPIINHEMLEMDAYIHITSPIRRLVDLLNIIKFQQNFGIIALSENATEFYLKWINQIDYVNVTMRAIRKVQNDCTLLDACYNDPQKLNKLYDGFCFDKLVRNDGLYQFIVYLPELKLTSRITARENMENFDKRQYKLFLFSNEEKFEKKIRLQIVCENKNSSDLDFKNENNDKL